MDSFDQEYRSRLQPQFLPIELPQSCNKVILRHIDSFSRHKSEDITLQIFMIYSIKVVKIELAVRKSRSIKPVYKIIVCRE